ncbi:MAG: hypothetical protein V1856_01835, partial [Candidatus Liptonbacteria bacterium]
MRHFCFRIVIGFEVLIVSAPFLVAPFAFARTASLSFSPAQIIQGEPLLVQIDGIVDIASVKSIKFDGVASGIFAYQGKPTALVGIDLNKKQGSYELVAELSDGRILKETVDIGERNRIEAPLGIPQKLGGSTSESQKKLIATLA